MIKITDLLKGILRDPFVGDLQEGLIRTVPIDQAMEIMGKEVENYPELDFLNDGNTIIIGFKLEHPTSQDKKYSTGTFYDPKISKVLTLTNNLGYFPSIVKYELNDQAEQYEKKYTPSSFRDLILNEEPTYLIFFFEAKYDPVVEVPQYVYHVTTTRFVDKIKQVGLTPKTLGKRSTHPERIYVSFTKKDSRFLLKGLKHHFGKDQGVELTIDTSRLKDPFYEDPNFKNRGAYTYQNIRPNDIVKYTLLK